MKTKLLLLTISISIASACTSVKEIPSEFRQKNSPYKHAVQFYGSPDCGHCKYFSANMQKESIPFVFYNVRASQENNKIMWQLVHSVDPKANSVRFPVLKLNEKVLVSPDYADFKKELRRLK